MHGRFSFEFEALERKLFLTSTPSSPRPDTLGTAFDKGERQILLDRLTHLDASTRSTLQTKLNTSVGQFDTYLLSLMRSRTTPDWFFDDSQVAGHAGYIGTNLSYADVVTHADDIVEFHKFPEQSSASTYTVDLPTSINWSDTSPSTNPEYVHTLNRHGFWVELAQASVITGNAKYMNELLYELADWSSEYPVATVPASWSASDQDGWQFDSAQRIESWGWTYFMALGDAQWTAAANSLMLYKFAQHADYLNSAAAATTDFASNRTLSLAKSLLMLGQVFPELDNASSWESAGRSLLFKCMDAQLFSDGSHVEQSPTYTNGVVEDILEAKWLDDINGDLSQWSGARVSQIDDAVESYRQMLSPDGTRPAIGDTYRNTSLTLFLKANLIEGTSQWPAAKPRLRDVWLFGPAAVNPFLGNPVYPSLGNRGDTYALTDSGNYIMRSGNSSTDRQIIFDAGSKGGPHGHFDLLNFELFGGGRPLISDPGAFKYDSSADRAYVISTRAHNTININGANTGALEGLNNPGIDVSQWTVTGSSAQVTASHRGYQYLAGRPVVSRSMWYDLDGTILIVDWGEGGASHQYQQSFNLQTEGNTANVTGVQPDGSFRTKYASGGNVKIAPVSRPGQTVARGGLTFVSNLASGDYKDDAYRFTVTQSGSFVCFVTLITAYDGTTAPNTTATLLNTPVAGGTVQVQLTKNGVNQTLNFTPPPVEHLDALATSTGAWNDIAFDSSNRLHLAYYDRGDKRLKYALRDANGNWSIPETVALPVSEIGAGEYQYISLALTSTGNPGIAYFDGWDGDLEYAHFTGTEWVNETVDAAQSVGLYPSLAYSRGNGPVITYYQRTKGDLRMATSATGGWDITTIDSGNDCGRFSSLLLDPNRPTVTKWAIAYENTTSGQVKFAIQGNIGPGAKANGYTFYTMDDVDICGGYISLAFFDTKSTDPTRRYMPAASFYNATNTSMKLAWAKDPNFGMTSATIATNKKGLYTNLFFDGASGNRANIFYFDRIAAKTARYVGILNVSNNTLGSSAYSLLAAGGREIHVSRTAGGAVAYTTLDEAVGELTVRII